MMEQIRKASAKYIFKPLLFDLLVNFLVNTNDIHQHLDKYDLEKNLKIIKEFATCWIPKHIRLHIKNLIMKIPKRRDS